MTAGALAVLAVGLVIIVLIRFEQRDARRSRVAADHEAVVTSEAGSPPPPMGRPSTGAVVDQPARGQSSMPANEPAAAASPVETSIDVPDSGSAPGPVIDLTDETIDLTDERERTALERDPGT